MDDKVIQAISKEAVTEFEALRQSGHCNMMDRRDVQNTSNQLGFHALASLLKSEYVMLLKNYSELMEHYQVKR